MIRTVWIAAFCLAGIGGLFATKVTASIPPAKETAPASVDITASLGQDTLIKADKFEFTSTVYAVETIPVVPARPTEVIQTKAKATADRGPRRLSSPTANRIAVMLPKPRPRIKLASNSPAKVAVDSKSQADVYF
jgi:hypothetical protein